MIFFIVNIILLSFSIFLFLIIKDNINKNNKIDKEEIES